MRQLCTTDEILKALEDRNTDALEWINSDYGNLLRSIAVNLGLGESDTEECMNDTYLEVWETIPPAKPKNIRSYLCMLMRRIVIDRIRYNSARKRANSLYLEVAGELADCLDMEAALVDGLTLSDALNSFLRGQDHKYREIFIRRYFEFESVKSIAKDLMMPSNTVVKRLSRMRNELKEKLKDRGYNND